MEKRIMKKMLGILLVFTVVLSICGCRVNTDYDLEKEVDRILNPSATETEVTGESDVTSPEGVSIPSESIPTEKTEVNRDSRRITTAQKVVMLAMGILLEVVGVVLIVIGTKLTLYARVFELCDTTKEAMGVTLKKDIAGFFGSLCKFIGLLILIGGILCHVAFFTVIRM